MPRRWSTSLRPPRRVALSPLLLGALAALSATACERRIEEPLATRPLDPTAIEPAREGSKRPPAPSRCLTPTPATPKRTATPGPDGRCPPDPLAAPPRLRAGKVTFVTGEGNGAIASAKPFVIDVEIAEDDKLRQRGLMFRKQMADDHGMIFVFQEREEHSFWMHNTCIPLDMIFVDEDGFIVGIEENTPTISDDTFSPGCPSKYVVEVNAGVARAHGVKAGQWVKMEL